MAAIAVVLTMAAGLAAPAARLSAQTTAGVHVVLISIDGLKPDYYLGRGANLPNVPTLNALREQGSWAEGVVAQYPSLTYVGHTSLATGLRRVHHGIV